MNWTWDPAKNRENLRKHGIRFENAIRVFNDQFVAIEEDPYPYEQRWKAIGRVRDVVITVVYTLPPRYPYNEDQPGRIISARKSTGSERRYYAEGETGTD